MDALFNALLSIYIFLFLSFCPKLQSFLQVNVTQVHVDECVAVDCSGGGGCMNRLSVSERPSVVDSDSMALVSVTLESTAVCSCSAREHLHQGCSTYPRNPCHNGGVCVDTQNGYRLDSFHGVSLCVCVCNRTIKALFSASHMYKLVVEPWNIAKLTGNKAGHSVQ